MDNNNHNDNKITGVNLKRSNSLGSVHNSVHGSRSSASTVSSTPSVGEKFFMREKIAFDPDVYINNPAFSDFKFKVGDQEIALSSVILSANSPFIFKNISQKGCMELDVSAMDLEIDQVLEMIRPCYNGQLTLTAKNVLNFLMFSILFEFNWIFDSCLVYFNENIKPELVFDFLEIGLRSQNNSVEDYKAVLKICAKYLEEGNNMQLTCCHIRESGKLKKVSRGMVDYFCGIETNNVIDIISLVLAWLKLGESNMEIVPSLLDSFDFTEVFYKNQDMAEQFFTHIITGDYSAEVRMRIMNLSFQSTKNIRPSKSSKAGFRMSRLKSVKKFDDHGHGD